MNDVLSIRQAATYAGVDRVTVRRWIKSGALPVYADARDRRRRLVLREDLDKATEPKIGAQIMVDSGRRAYAT